MASSSSSLCKNHNTSSSKSKALSSLMSKEKPTTLTSTKSYKALITTKRDSISNLSQKGGHVSYSLKITMPTAKVRIKIPKLLANTVKKESSDNHKTKHLKKWGHPKSPFHIKVTSLLSNAFGSKKIESECHCFSCEKIGNSSTKRSCDGRRSNVSVNEEEDRNRRFLETKLCKTEIEGSESFRSGDRMTSIGDSLSNVVEPFVLEKEEEPNSQFLVIHSLRKNASENPLDVKPVKCNEKGEEICMGGKQPLKASSHMKKLLMKRILLKFGICGRNGAYRSSSTGGGGGGRSKFLIKHKGWKLHSLGKKVGEKIKMEDDEEEGDRELCKKKILMGERCRPLNIEDSLHYSRHGMKGRT